MQSGIVLFAKPPGITSFSSLFAIKKALATKKVGHTGTLDSFASGLLVVCTGSLTRLASYITALHKTYDAVIEFGNETDTLEYTGNIVKTAPLPKKNDVLSAIAHHTGDMLQTPPLFSALHINGERASSIARSGRKADMPSRPVSVYSAEAEEFLFEKDDFVKAVRVRFSVSKGTYIRSLARDIGSYCKSAAHLAGLRRLSVGSFRLEDAAGASSLKPFTIRSVYETISEMRESNAALCKEGSPVHIPHANGEVPPSLAPRPRAYEKDVQSEVREKMQTMTERLAVECGFRALRIFSEYEADFKHGRPLFSSMFEKTAGGIGEASGTSSDLGACTKSDARSVNGDCTAADAAPIAVFGSRNRFLGMIAESGSGAYSYAFVSSD